MPLIDLLNPYAYAMLLRRWLYKRGILKSAHPDIPVISVGNLTMGGTGKSPMVMLIANYLIEQRQKRVAIVSRGYKRTSKGFLVVSDGKQILANVEASGDEPQMFAQLLPRAIIIVDEDRVRGAQQARKLGAQIVLLDDAYQHLRIKRDLDILLVDPTKGISPVLPFGRGRESVLSARSAGVVVFTNAGDKSRLTNLWSRLKPHLKQGVPVVSLRAVARELRVMETGELVPMSELQYKRVMAISSIASPRRFSAMLEAAGAYVVARDLGDHASHSDTLVIALMRDAARSGVEAIVITQKDAVKARHYFDRMHGAFPILVLSQEFEFLQGERLFYNTIDRLL